MFVRLLTALTLLVAYSANASAADSAVLLITAEELADAWRPFADWKTTTGRPTTIVTVEQAKAEFPADIVQESLRLCVRDHIDNHGTRWVLLGADCEPNGGGLVPGGHTTFHAQERRGIPTDIVYLSPTNWDADGDGRHGEFEDDRDAITYPDGSVGLGRVPVRTTEDVKAFTDKVIAYESDYPTGDFAKRMIYTCTEPSAYPKVMRSWDEYVSSAWDGKADRYFAHKTPWDDEGKPGSHELSANNLVELLNAGDYGKLHIHGHGFLPAWVLEGSMFTGKQVGQLKNKNAYPLITTVSCFTGQYDAKRDPSIAERMIRQPNAGSVAIVAPVRTGKPHFAKRSDIRLMISEGKLDGTTMTMTNYWRHGLADEATTGSATTGHALMMAKADMADDAKASLNFHLCVCELNLLGDPTLLMRSKPPTTPQLTVLQSLPAGKATLAIRTDAPGATVTLSDGNDLYQTATADKQGNAEFAFTASEELTVGVYGNNLNAVTRKVQVN